MSTTVRFRVYGSNQVTLTTDHAASSYGPPVLLVDGDNCAYGPGDRIVIGRGRGASPRMDAGHFVKLGLQLGMTGNRARHNSPEAVALAAAFLSQSPSYARYAGWADRQAGY